MACCCLTLWMGRCRARNGELVVDRVQIAKCYMRGWMLIDIASCLPVGYVELLAGAFTGDPRTLAAGLDGSTAGGSASSAGQQRLRLLRSGRSVPNTDGADLVNEEEEEGGTTSLVSSPGHRLLLCLASNWCPDLTNHCRPGRRGMQRAFKSLRLLRLGKLLRVAKVKKILQKYEDAVRARSLPRVSSRLSHTLPRHLPFEGWVGCGCGCGCRCRCV
jgi:hypothetical protein